MVPPKATNEPLLLCGTVFPVRAVDKDCYPTGSGEALSVTQEGKFPRGVG